MPPTAAVPPSAAVQHEDWRHAFEQFAAADAAQDPICVGLACLSDVKHGRVNGPHVASTRNERFQCFAPSYLVRCIWKVGIQRAGMFLLLEGEVNPRPMWH
jgi:hypothetical protein